MGMRTDTASFENDSANDLGSTLSITSKQAEREELNRQIEEFFARGKTIDVDEKSCGPYHYLEDVPEDDRDLMAFESLPKTGKQRPKLTDVGSKFYKGR